MDSFDDLKLGQDKAVLKQLEAGETVIFSSLAFKFNEVNKKQERTLLITNLNIFNLNSKTVKRKIPIKKVFGITIGTIGSEFIMHVPDEYDYRYSSPERRDQAVLSILMALKGGSLPIFFKDEIALTAFCTTKIDKKNKISRLPNGGSESINADQFRKRMNLQQEEKMQNKARTSTWYAKKKGEQVCIDDFNLIKVLGRGAFGKVMLVEKKDDKRIFAMKSIRKEDIADPEQLEHTKTERIVLENSNNLFLVHLEYAFQTPEKIFFVTEFMRGGELFQHLKAVKRFDEKRTKFYTAEIILALEFLHSRSIIYRDLKPENVLMDDLGHVCLTDFGMAKILRKNEKAMTFCGTPEYLAPEILQEVGHNQAADWWALGIFTYEMLFALPTFYSKNQDLMFKNIQTKDVVFPPSPMITEDCKDFIKRILVKDPAKRLGSVGGAEEIKSHPWFSDIDWVALSKKEVTPPFKPGVQGEDWINNFDKQFTEEQPINSYAPNSDLINQEEFKEFDYYK